VTKTSLDKVFDLQYADNPSIPNDSPIGSQCLLRSRAGFVVNTKKTEILAYLANISSHLSLYVSGNQLSTVELASV